MLTGYLKLLGRIHLFYCCQELRPNYSIPTEQVTMLQDDQLGQGLDLHYCKKWPIGEPDDLYKQARSSSAQQSCFSVTVMDIEQCWQRCPNRSASTHWGYSVVHEWFCCTLFVSTSHIYCGLDLLTIRDRETESQHLCGEQLLSGLSGA